MTFSNYELSHNGIATYREMDAVHVLRVAAEFRSSAAAKLGGTPLVRSGRGRVSVWTLLTGSPVRPRVVWLRFA